MYGSFYRDPCSAGLIVLQSMAKEYFGTGIREAYQQFYLTDALFRIDYWRAETKNRFALRELEGPVVGNPFGAVVEGTLVRAGAEYQHYCAMRIEDLLDSDEATVAEIGGGFGGMAYYLLRNRMGRRYINFDVPESVALMSYYLMKAFPKLKFLLYGEGELSERSMAQADVVLMPTFELAKIPRVDVTFSSHAISDLSSEAITEYLEKINMATRGYFLCIGEGRSANALAEVIREECTGWSLVEERALGWNAHRVPKAREVEYLYRVGVA